MEVEEEEKSTDKGKLKDKDKEGDTLLFHTHYDYYSLNHSASIHTNRGIIRAVR